MLMLPIVSKSGTSQKITSIDEFTTVKSSSGFLYVDKPFYRNTGVHKVKIEIVSTTSGYNLIGFTGSKELFGYSNSGDNVHLYGNGMTRHVTSSNYTQSNTAFSYTTGDTVYVKIDTDNLIASISKDDVTYVVWSKNIDLLNNNDYFYLFVGGNSATFAYDIYHEYYYKFHEKKILLQSNNKIYSLESIDTWHETNMTSNTAPAPLVASASSTANTNYPAWKGFNGTTENNLDAWIANGKTGHLQLDFGQNKKSNRLQLTPRNDSETYLTYFPKDIKILGSNDNVDFLEIGKATGLSPSSISEKIEIPFVLSNFKIYRIEVLDNNGGRHSGFGEAQFGYKKTNINLLPSKSKQNFIEYGMKSPIKTDGIFNIKKYILQDVVSEDVDGLWKTQLNRKPLSISFN